MNKKIKLFAVILALFGFSASLFAEPVTYSFSGFGGGLPSSAAKVSKYSSSDTPQQTIIVEDDEDYDYDYSDEPTVKKGKSTALIITYVVIGVVVVAGIAVGAYYLTNSSADCCATATDNFIEGCGQGCGESCSASMDEACASSVNEACSSSSSSSTTCSSQSLGNMIVNGFELIPIYVP